tara:strand:+ start:6002 stop:8029 length:2028 start_codon:yes stop_codon:yes gene_type:complete
MTISISNNNPRVSYTVAQGATQSTFAVSFEFFAAADLNVYVDGTLKSLTTHYTVTGGDGSTGSVAISVTGASGGSTVLITRDIALERTTDFPISGAFQVETLNTELDRFIAIQADINDTVSRSVRLADEDEAVSMELPLKANRVGTVLGFNATTGAAEAGPTIANVNSLSAITTNINTVAGISSDITTVANNNSNVTTVAGISSNVTTVAGISSNVTTVAGKASLITTDFASDMALIDSTFVSKINLVTSDFITDMNLVTSDFISDLNTVASSDFVSDLNTIASSDFVSDLNAIEAIKADVTTVANNITSVNSFAERYRISSSAPSTSLDVGDLWFDTTNNVLKVYEASQWVPTVSNVNATNERGDFTVGTSAGSYSGSTTVFPATYDVGFIDVYLNGVKLAAADFTATNGTSITLASAASSGDSLQTVAYSTFDSANHYTKTSSDARYAQLSNNLSDVTASTARTNLGLGTIATQASNAVAITGGSLSNLTALEVDGGLIELKSNTGAVAKLDMYCENSNAHKVTLQPPAHANYTGNVVSTLPNTTGTLINDTGATFTGDVTFKQTIDESTPITSSSNAATIDLNLGNVFTHTLSENVTYTFSNPGASGKASSFILKVTQDSSARTITFPASVDWASATAPTLTSTSGGVDVFGFFTVDGGNTYYGFTLGQAMG